MKEETLLYIRKHPHIYQYLREHSEEYEKIFKDNNYIYELDEKVKEIYQIRWSDKMNKLGNSIQIFQTFLDCFK